MTILRKLLINYGLITMPITLWILAYTGAGNRTIDGEMIAMSFFPAALIALETVMHEDKDYYMRRKLAAMHPPVNPKLLCRDKDASGLCIGRYHGRQVCRTLEDQGSTLIVGGSGTGKSSCLIVPQLLLQKKNLLTERSEPPQIHYLVCDPKGELTALTRCPGDDTWVFSPKDRAEAVGFDPLYGITDDSSDQELQERMRVIAISMIPDGKAEQIWSKAAKNMLTGLLMYFYRYPRNKESKTLPNLLLMITEKSITDTVQEVMEQCEPDSVIHTLLADYHGMGADTLTSVDFNLKDSLKNFATDTDIVYALSGNLRKFQPADLLAHNVMICIPLDKLEQYGSLFFIITNLCLSWALGLPEHLQEPERPYVGFILDELVALLDGTNSKPTILLQALRVIRSKGAMIVCAIQSISGLECVMSKAEVGDFISNFMYRVILDCSDNSQRMICDWAGSFRYRKTSWSGTGSKRKSSTSWEKDKILDENSLVTLGKSDELLLFSAMCTAAGKGEKDPGFATLKKTPYYKDRYYKHLFQKVKELRQKSGANL